MIQYIRLSNWKAYEALDIDFKPGTTFIVAPNGVGKTSLVMALAWGLYGDKVKNIIPKECIRAGANQAKVEIALKMHDGAILKITRVIKKRGQPIVIFDLNDDIVEPMDAENRLAGDFGVDLETAARLSLMMDGGHIFASKALDLQSHLHHAFGVSDLIRASELAKELATRAERRRKALSETNRRQLSDRSEITDEIRKLEQELKQGEQTKSVLQTDLISIDQVRKAAIEWDLYHSQLSELHYSLTELNSEVSELVGDQRSTAEVNKETIGNRLMEARSFFGNQGRKITSQLSEAYAAKTSAQNALELLSEEYRICPTCLQTIAADNLEAARTSHALIMKRSQKDIERLEVEAAHITEQIHQVEKFRTRLYALTDPKKPISGATTRVGAIETDYQDALTSLNKQNETIGAIRSRIKMLHDQLADDELAKQDQLRLTAAFRREGIATAMVHALETTAEELTANRIKPIATEVEWRWKQLFGDGGLEFRPDGTITRIVNGENLSWETLSGGERIWARLVTHLLVVETSTGLSTVWFDEPLEHLDPKLRRTVAGFLATTAAHVRLKQLIVTTYEHALAAQLAEDNDNTSIVYIR